MLAELFFMILLANDWDKLTEQQQATIVEKAAKEYFIKHPNCQESQVIAETDGIHIKLSAECVKVAL